MSLVAYGVSSDEDSDHEENEGPKAVVVPNTAAVNDSVLMSVSEPALAVGNISDEDEDFIPQVGETERNSLNSISQLLPKPKNYSLTKLIMNFEKPTFSALPAPKAVDTQFEIEADDEFLHKKPKDDIIDKAIKNIENKKLPVKISIPSLRNFDDVEKEIADKARNKSAAMHSGTPGSSGLLSMLPKPKSEQNFAKATDTISKKNESINAVITFKPTFVPDSVKHRRPATNTEDVDSYKQPKKKLHNHTNKTSAKSNIKPESDESDDDTASGDFFSFNADQTLPEISAKELNALVAKKAAKMVDTTTNYLKSNETQKSFNEEEMHVDEHESHLARKRYHSEQQLNSEALQALVGGSTKRRRYQQSDIEVIDINSSQVMPDKEEWMRTALTSSTSYQPTGVLVDEEPVSGTRRKHQITYLAHKAKANEAELQAMWSANRQNRRATQSKYGF